VNTIFQSSSKENTVNHGLYHVYQ